MTVQEKMAECEHRIDKAKKSNNQKALRDARKWRAKLERESRR